MMKEEKSELEKCQEESFKPVVGQYLFEATLSGAETKLSPVLNAEKPGIHLHFYRYGLFTENEDSNTNQALFYDNNGNKTGNPEKLSPNGAPEVKDFYYARTSLHGGYLYIIDANNKNLFWEYEVDSSGSYFPVYWKNNKDENGKYNDIRKSSQKSLPHITFKQDTELWVAFSPVQWSIEYHNTILNNEDRKQERMLKIKCTGFKEGEVGESDFLLPFDKMYTTYPPEEHYQGIWYRNQLKEAQADYKADYLTDPEAIKENMFVTLHSPLGCAMDINKHLGMKHVDFRALVENIQTGQNLNQIKEQLLNANMEINPVSNEYRSLFVLALTCYQLVYSDRQSTEKYDGGLPGKNFLDTHFPKELAKQNEADRIAREKRIKNRSYSSGGYGNGYAELGAAIQENRNNSYNRYHKELYIDHGLDRQKVEGILGVQDRQQLREKVLALRNVLGQFLKSEYFKTVLDDYLHNIEVNKLDGMAGVSMILANLYLSPYDMDRHLLLEKNRQRTDAWKTWIQELADEDSTNSSVKQTGVKSKTPGYESLDPLHALMSSGFNLENDAPDKFGLGNKLVGYLNAHLNFLSGKAFDMKRVGNSTISEVKEFVVKKLQNKKYKGDPIYLLRQSEIYAQLDAFGVTGDKLKSFVKIAAPYKGRHDWLRIYQNSHDVRVEIDGNKKIYLPVDYDVELTSKQVKQNQFNQKVAKIVNSKVFTGAMAGLQMLNVYNAVTEFDEEKNYKSSVSTAGVAADLTETILNVQKARLMTKGVTETGTIGLKTWSTRFGAIGGFATSAICIWDAVETFQKSDDDAALALAGAGVAYGVSATMLLVGATGPIGLIAAGIGFGFILLAGILSDSDLEYYFKHFLLSERVAFSRKEAESPGAYALRILKSQEFLMGEDPEPKDIKSIMHPGDAYARIWDLLVCTHMQFTPVKTQTNIKTAYTNNGPLYSRTVKYFSFEVSLHFMQFLNANSNIEVHTWLFPQGIKNGNPQQIPWQQLNTANNKNNIIITAGKNNSNILYLQIDIPTALQSKVKIASEILLAVRIKGEANQSPSFPFSMQNSGTRYLGALANMGTYAPLFGTEQKVKIKIDTLINLKKTSTWQ